MSLGVRGFAVTATAWPAALRRLQARHLVLADGLLAVALGTATLAGTSDAAHVTGADVRPLDGPGYALVVTAAAALAYRRRAPLAAFTASFAATMTFLLLRYPLGPIVQLTGVAAYSVAAWRPDRAAAACLASAAVAMTAVPAVGYAGQAPGSAWGTVTLTLAWSVLPWAAGAAVRGYREARDRAADAERRRYADAERLRVAKEVHDVAGHALAVISMQAGVALHVLGERPEQPPEVAAALRAIRATGGEALRDLRTTLAAFPDGTADRRPPAGLDRVPALVTALAGGRFEVDLVVTGRRGRIPAPVDTAGHRIVQEALTNVLKHAAARRVTVRIAYARDAVELRVDDDGRGPRPASGAPAGLGLAGMAERARALGGTLDAGPGAGGQGFRVRAVLPYGTPDGSRG